MRKRYKNLIGLSTDIAKARWSMNTVDLKLCFIILNKIKWKEKGNDRMIKISVEEVLELLDPEQVDVDKTTVYVRTAAARMCKNSNVIFDDGRELQIFECSSCKCDELSVTVNEEAMRHFEGLNRYYILISRDDILGLPNGGKIGKNAFAHYRYLYMQAKGEYGKELPVELKISDIKGILGIDRESYFRDGKFMEVSFSKMLWAALTALGKLRVLKVLTEEKPSDEEKIYITNKSGVRYCSGYKVFYIIYL